MARLSCDDVSFRYPGSSRTVLAGVTLTADAGDVLSLVGDNGEGKSTLGQVLCALLPPTTGSILVDGQPIPRNSRLRVLTAYYIGQEARDYMVGATMREEVAFSLRQARISMAHPPDPTPYWLPPLDTEPLSLTTSETWRLSLLIAACLRPGFLFIDEIPTTASERNLSTLISLLGDRTAQSLVTMLAYQRPLPVTLRVTRQLTITAGRIEVR
jgi:ABC-type multidrug transport system ATPase subunit